MIFSNVGREYCFRNFPKYKKQEEVPWIGKMRYEVYDERKKLDKRVEELGW